jgi:hypothetical protein
MTAWTTNQNRRHDFALYPLARDAFDGMSNEPNIPQQAIDDADGCLRYGAGFVIGVLAALGTTYTWHRAMLASPGHDREGGGAMALAFVVLPLLVIVLGPAGIVIAWITRKPGKHRWVLWTLLAVFVAYPFSAIPVDIGARWLRDHSQGDYKAVVDLIYAPAQWPFQMLGL